MTKHEVVSEEQWIEARRALLAEEKAWTRERDRFSAKRRALPWVKVEKDYVFEGTNGPVSLADLFDGRSQLIVRHFMFGPEWEEGCPGCSLLSDQVDGARQHFEHNDVSFVTVSRGPIEKLEAYRQRMGWKFRWVSSAKSDFNFDYHDTYSTYGRGGEVFLTVYAWLDVVPKGRNETMSGNLSDWARRHDSYENYGRTRASSAMADAS